MEWKGEGVRGFGRSKGGGGGGGAMVTRWAGRVEWEGPEGTEAVERAKGANWSVEGRGGRR